MGVRSYLREIFGPEPSEWRQQDNVCAVCGGVNIHHKDCVGATFSPELVRPAPKPRLAVVSRAPSREEFDAWRDHPVTQFVFAGLRAAARAQKEAWADSSWEQGISSEILLNELRVRADAYSSLEEGGYEAFCEWAGVEPEPEG